MSHHSSLQVSSFALLLFRVSWSLLYFSNYELTKAKGATLIIPLSLSPVPAMLNTRPLLQSFFTIIHAFSDASQITPPFLLLNSRSFCFSHVFLLCDFFLPLSIYLFMSFSLPTDLQLTTSSDIVKLLRVCFECFNFFSCHSAQVSNFFFSVRLNNLMFNAIRVKLHKFLLGKWIDFKIAAARFPFPYL